MVVDWYKDEQPRAKVKRRLKSRWMQIYRFRMTRKRLL